MKFCVLATGSKGNCLYVASGSTQVLIDAGLSRKQVQSRLAEIGVSLDGVQALCVTHNHSDHILGLPVLAKRHGLALYATEGTCSAVEFAARKQFEWHVFAPGSRFTIGDLHIDAFSVSHDATDPVGFVISDGTSRLGIATDMGEVPDLVRHHLRGCHALLIEFNHDRELLLNSDRAWHLKQRILGRRGHLSNDQASDLLQSVAGEQLHTVFLAHISEECNTPQIASRCAASALAACGLTGVTRICLHGWPSPLIDV